MKSLLSFLVVAATLATAGPASAATGTLSGRLTFYQNNGHYCPTSRNCTGALYTESQFHTFQPLREGKVVLLANGGATQIGIGTTNVLGQFSVSWNFSGTIPANGVPIVIRFVAEHKDGKFRVTGSGTSALFFNAPATLFNASYDMGDVQYGAANMANPFLNLYDAGWSTWTYALSASNFAITRITGVMLKGFYAGGECATTCADVVNKVVKMGEGEQFRPMTAAHEFGHVASYLFNAFGGNDYTYPQTCDYDLLATCSNVHDIASSQWQSAQFEEGFSSFVATAAYYSRWAPAPHFCVGLSSLPCTNNAASFVIEPSAGLSAGCSLNQRRNEMTVTRYLWDVYDTVIDANIPDNSTRSYSVIYDGMGNSAYGFGDLQIHEKLVLFGTSDFEFDDRDGHNAFDHLRNMGSSNGNNQYLYNCGFNGNGTP